MIDDATRLYLESCYAAMFLLSVIIIVKTNLMKHDSDLYTLGGFSTCVFPRSFYSPNQKIH